MAAHAAPPAGRRSSGGGVGARRRTRARRPDFFLASTTSWVVFLFVVVVVALVSTLIPSASAAAASHPQRQEQQGAGASAAAAAAAASLGEYDADDADSYADDDDRHHVAAPDLREDASGGQKQQRRGRAEDYDEGEEEDEYEDPPGGPHRDDTTDADADADADADDADDDADEVEAAAGIIDMTTPDYLAEHEGAVLDAEAEAEYARELQEQGLEVADARRQEEEQQLPADKKLTELEDKLYFGNLTSRNVTEAFRGLFEFVAGAPTLEEAKEMNRVLKGGAAEARRAEAREKLAAAQADIMRAFMGVEVEGGKGGEGGVGGEMSGGGLMAGEDAVTLEDIPGHEGKLNIKFNFKLLQGSGKAAARAQAIFRALGAASAAPAGEDEPEEPDDETQEAIDAVRAGIKNAIHAKHAAGLVTTQEDSDPANAPAAPEDWLAVSDALYLLAALVEAGVVTPDAYPQPPRAGHPEEHPSQLSKPSSKRPFTAADYSAGWSAFPVSENDGRHPAAADPTGWAREALLVSAEMGSTEARLAVGDRILHGRGGYPETEDGPSCEAALDWIRPVADQAAKDAESSGDFQLPRQPGRLRERERDARWVSEEELENGDEQITMEEDMAARGVPEAQRHIGYRRLVGRGVDRDEAGALREFEAAAANGDELAAFNLGYMHMKGLSVPQNFTEARKRFDAAVAKELPAAYNGIGVLHFNGWGTPRNYTAARLAFEEGAERGDPDSHFNLGALHSSGLGVPRDQEKAVKCYEAASQAGHWRAPHVLGIAHQTGHGTPRNCTRAAQLLRVFVEERLAWTRDQEDAMAVLDGGAVADVDEDGADAGTSHHSPPDPWSALVRYTLLAEKGSESATANAAWMLAKGVGYLGNDNTELAERMHERSVMLGNKEAHVDLGDIKWAKLKAGGGPRLSPPAEAAAVREEEEEERREAEASEAEEATSGGPEKQEAGASGGTSKGTADVADDADDAADDADRPIAGKEADEDERAPKATEVGEKEHTPPPAEPPKPPRPLRPPPGATPEEEIAFHYGEAAHAGYAEGTVNLAWAYAHGVGVDRNLSHASELLYRAYVDSPTEVEGFAPLLALAGVKCWAALERAAQALGLGRALSGLTGYDSRGGGAGDAWMAAKGKKQGVSSAAASASASGGGADPRVAGAGGYPTENTERGGGIAAESGRKPMAAWMFPPGHAYTALENVLLGVLLFMAVLVGYTRFVYMERPGGGEAAAEVARGVNLAAVAGAGAAVAVGIGIGVSIAFMDRRATALEAAAA